MKYSKDFLVSLGVMSTIVAAGTILNFSLPLFAYELSQSGTGLALIKGVGFVPNILFAIFIGVINDRLLKKRAFQFYTFGLAALTLLLLLALLYNAISLPALALFIIFFNGLNYATGNAQLALIRLSVDPEKLSDATALTSTVHAVIGTAGPAAAGFLLLQMGHLGVITLCFIVLATSFCGASLLSPREQLAPRTAFWPSFVEGWRVLTANRELVMMTIVIVLTNAAEGAFGTALILKLKTSLAANDFEIGLVLAAAGIGAVIGSRIAAPLRRKLGYRTAFFWPIWGLAALYLSLIFNLPLWLICILSFFEGGLSLFFAIGVWSYRQESTEAAHMGRVAGLTGAIFKLGMPPIIILSGAMVDLGFQNGVLVLAAAINVFAALFLVTIAGWGWPIRQRAKSADAG